MISSYMSNEIDEITKTLSVAEIIVGSSMTTNQDFIVEDFGNYNTPVNTNAIYKKVLQNLDEACNESLTEPCSDSDKVKLIKSYGYAKLFIELLFPRHFLITPEIYVEPDFEIALDWVISKNKYLSISVSQSGSLTYASIFYNSRSRGREIMLDEIPETLLLQIQRINKTSLH